MWEVFQHLETDPHLQPHTSHQFCVRVVHSICKWAKPVFWLGCYRCIFHGTGNLAQLFINFGISGGGGVWTPQTPPLLGTPVLFSLTTVYIFEVRHR
jgi:hypothetical protein